MKCLQFFGAIIDSILKKVSLTTGQNVYKYGYLCILKAYHTFKKLYSLSAWKGDRRESNLEVTKEIWMAEESKEKREQKIRKK